MESLLLTLIIKMHYHNPVLLKECIEGLNINPAGVYVDVTFGGGGHSREILKHLTTGKLYAFDQDEDAVKNSIGDDRFVLIKQNFRYLKNFLKMYDALPIDGLLADLGVSSHQFDEAERGFSIRFDAKLDMRMDQNAKQTAAEVLNTYSEEDLKRIFRLYGEVENAGYLASIIFHNRKDKQIETVNDLKTMIVKCVKRGRENQYYAQVFQALRIEVNKELDVLQDLLMQSLEVLKPGGRFSIITFHSIEDRIVKNFFRQGSQLEISRDPIYGIKSEPPFEPLFKKPIEPSPEETKRNPRSRSARLRVGVKNEE